MCIVIENTDQIQYLFFSEKSAKVLFCLNLQRFALYTLHMRQANFSL